MTSRLASYPVLLGVALFIRVVYVLAVDYEPYSDMAAYHSSAMSVFTGEGFPSAGQNGDQKPLYPYFIAAVYGLFGPSLVALRLVQAGLGAIVCLMTVAWGRRISDDPKLPWIAGYITACYPDLVLHCGSILTETLYTFLLMVGLLLWQVGAQTSRRDLFAGAGLIFGAALLTRSVLVFAMPFAYLAYLARFPGPWRGKVINLSVLSVCLFLAVSPWLVRNKAVYGEFTVPSNEMGVTLWGGNNDLADGSWVQSAHITHADSLQMEDLSPLETNAYYADRGLEWIRENPTRFALLVPLKIGKMLGIKPDAIFRGSFFSPVAEMLVPSVFKAALLLLSFLGLTLCFVGQRSVWIIHALLAGHLVMTIVFIGYPRYLVPLIPALSILSAGAIVWLRGLWVNRESWSEVSGDRRWLYLSIVLVLTMNWTHQFIDNLAKIGTWMGIAG